MAKKIYDVMPPEIANNAEKPAKVLDDSGARKKSSARKARSKQVKKRFPLRELLVGSGVIVILLAVYFYYALARAEIKIWPKVEPLTLEEKITADTSVVSYDVATKVIPAYLKEEEKDGMQEFPSTGITSSDGKASGTIKAYNSISPSSPFVLKAGTHFLSDSGKYFVTLQKVTVPGMKGKTPGVITVNVQAEESGPDYNIGASKFSVPKLSGTSYYYSIWGESDSAMAGGYTGQVKKVTQDDIDQAKDVFTKKLLAEAEESLKRKLSSDDVLLADAVQREIVEADADAKEGVIADSFNESAKVKVSALVFKKDDLEKFIHDDLSSKVSADETLLEKDLPMTYVPEAINLSSKTLVLDVTSSAHTYAIMDKDRLMGAFGGKSADEAKALVDQLYGDKVSQLTVHFWPFWVHQIPKDKNKISVNLYFNAQ